MTIESTAPAVLRYPTLKEFDWIVDKATRLAVRSVRHRQECEAHAASVVMDYLLADDPARNVCLVAEHDGEHVGAGIVMGKVAGNAELVVFFVDPVARGKEIGDCLLNACMEFAVGPRYDSLSCTTTLFPDCAEPFLHRFGFRPQESGREWRREL